MGRVIRKVKVFMYADNNEVATYTINGISKQNSQTGGSTTRGMSIVGTGSDSNGGKLSPLNDTIAVYEFDQDHEGNYTAKVWEWK